MFRRKRKAAKPKQEADCNTAAEQTADALAQATLSTLGHNAALSLDQSLMAQSQAHGVLFANMVSEQQRLVAAGGSAAIKNAAEILGVSPEKIDPLNSLSDEDE